IEEAETGDQGKVRQLLSKAVRAPRDPAWVADGIVSERWAPVSPVTGRLDAFEWRAPMERLGQLIDSRDVEPDAPVVAIEATDRPEKPVEVIDHAA
ncbi:MAG: heme biosynthesis protein HemY, partial [Mesorhizobium sp.]